MNIQSLNLHEKLHTSPKQDPHDTSEVQQMNPPATNTTGDAQNHHETAETHTKSPASKSHPAKSSFAFDMYPDLPDRFHLQSILGEGAFSTVYKAWDTLKKTTVAIKIINKVNLSAKQLKNINNEIAVMKNLNNHQNILQLLDSFSSKSHTFLILEYSNGGEIFNKILEYTYFSESLSKHIFVQLLSSIEYLHSQNIVHRDIKPENLLFTKIPYFPRSHDEFTKSLRKSDDAHKKDEGEFKPSIGGGTIGVVKLADFGLAKQLHITHNALKTPCGTAGYTAPEVIACNDLNEPTKFSIAKKNYYNKSVDIWSLGCLLYTMLCGFPPFYDDDANLLTMKILNGDYVFLEPWWDEISSDVKDLITRMLETSPVERISIAEIWEHPWIKGSYSNVAKDATSSSYFYKYGVSASNDTEEEFEEELCDEDENDENDKSFLSLNLSNQPLLSPQASAIKKVFDNPAMTGNDDCYYNQSTVHFIENISEEDYESDEPLCARKKSLTRAMKSPFPDKFPVKFRNIFDSRQDDEEDSETDGNSEYDGTDSDGTDEVTSLTDFKVKLVGAQGSKLVPSIMYDDNEEDLTSTIDDEEAATSEDSEYQTRSSSIISGLAGDFKFTLNLNESNLLSRRRSSTVSKKNGDEAAKCVC